MVSGYQLEAVMRSPRAAHFSARRRALAIGAIALTICAANTSARLPPNLEARALASSQPHPFVPVLISNRGYGSELPIRLLAAHNRERARVGVSPLIWDTTLAITAASYGPELERLGTLQHSPRGNRPGTSENLWTGTRSNYTPEAMVESWIDENKMFRPGIFPNVSTTGNWADVGHYTVVIWPTVTAVGCALHRSQAWDYLICRYSPKGNIDGRGGSANLHSVLSGVSA